MDDDDDSFVTFGTALEPIEEDTIIKKKPVAIQDQVVVDENGRRRFHGAFTGGFSAGYYNTVGSKEGWAPAQFKSSRSDRGSSRVQNAQDFMDEEDIGAFGIAPQVLRPTDEFASQKRGLKRPRPAFSDGPIPGEPVLHRILEPVIETVGIKVLRKMGWRPGQGIGSKELLKSKKKRKELQKEVKEKVAGDAEPNSETTRMYGCALPPSQSGSDEDTDSDCLTDEENLRPLLQSPKDINSPVYNPKENTFGLGYKGLDRNTLVSGHVDLFGPSLKFKVDDRNANIRGEAFGIGVFEDEDEEVYSRDDMSQYDFALETPGERKHRLRKEAHDKRNNKKADNTGIPGFIRMKNPPKPKYFPPPKVPEDFIPVHSQRKSRFEEVEGTSIQNKKLGLDRHQLSRQQRQLLLEDAKELESNAAAVISHTESNAEISANKDTKVSDSITSVSPSESRKNESDAAARVERLQKFTEILQAFSSQKTSTAEGAFKPFMKHPGKQERYDKYITLKAAGYAECLKDLQPQEMTEWEREREKMEFDRASELYKPMTGQMSSRFVSAKSHDISHLVPEREKEKDKDPSQDPKVAAKMSLFGKLTHKIFEWHPDRLVSKRFNVPPPYPDSKMVGVRHATNTLTTKQPETPQPQDSNPPPKKSLFENLDFSKPPPGLVSAAVESVPGEGAHLPIDTSSASQLEFSKTLAGPTTSEETEKITMPVRPPMDLFKEIFADTSESESEEEYDKKEQPAAKETRVENRGEITTSKTADPTKPKEYRKNEEEGQKLVRDKITTPELEHELAEAPNKVDKFSRQEKTGGIFHNLDFSKLSSTENTPGQPVMKQTTNEKNEREKIAQSTLSVTPKLTSSSVKENDVISEEPAYGPAPPSNVIKYRKPTAKSDLTQGTSGSNFSSSHEKKQSSVSQLEDDGNLWVEKDHLQTSSKSSKKKHSKKSHKSRHKHKSKKSKKHRSSSKHKSKKHKHKNSKRRSRSNHGGRNESSSDSESSNSNSDSDSESEDAIPIYHSENSKALIAKLKELI